MKTPINTRKEFNPLPDYVTVQKTSNCTGSMADITLIQLQTLKFIHGFYNTNGYPPSIVEIATANNVAGNAIQGRINSLIKKSFLTKKPKIARSLLLTEKGMSAITLQ